MRTTRLEAFSDGVLAIVITIMVLELKVPHAPSMAALTTLWPVFSSYVLSFVYVGIYWNNHHHMMAATEEVDGAVLWGNLHLLFWLSLLPFTTGWMGENHFARLPTVLYGANLLACALAYYLLQRLIVRLQGAGGMLAAAIGRDLKGKLSPLFYIVGMAAAWFAQPWIGMVLFVMAALVWAVPDRRIERIVGPASEPR